MGMMDYAIVGGVLIGGYLLLFTDTFANLFPPASGGGGSDGGGGGEFIDGGSGAGGGEFIVEDTPNPTGECKSKYNGKCKSECASDKYSARCQDCLAVCGGGQGQPPGQCYSVGMNKSVPCGSTSNSCTGTAGKLTCKCGSNVPGNKIRDNRAFVMGGLRTCAHCTQYCKTGVVPSVSPGTTPGTVGVTPTGRIYPKRISANCTQVSASSFNWVSSGKMASGKSCTDARSAWCRRYTSNNCGASSGGSTGGTTRPQPVTSTLCKCGSGTAKHVLGDCSACKRVCSRTCGLCSPQCLGTRTNMGYYFEDAAEDYFDTGLRFANMAMAI